MRASPLVLVAVLAAVGQSLQTPAWARDLSVRLDAVPNTLSSLVAREPKRGGGSSSHSSGSDDDDDSSSSSSGGSSCSSSNDLSTNNCLSSEKICGKGCIAKDAVCCALGDVPSYCESNERCVTASASSTRVYRCCPANNFSCDGTSSSSSLSWPAQYRYSSNNGACSSTSSASQSTISGIQALVGGVALSFAVGIAH